MAAAALRYFKRHRREAMAFPVAWAVCGGADAVHTITQSGQYVIYYEPMVVEYRGKAYAGGRLVNRRGDVTGVWYFRPEGDFRVCLANGRVVEGVWRRASSDAGDFDTAIDLHPLHASVARIEADNLSVDSCQLIANDHFTPVNGSRNYGDLLLRRDSGGFLYLSWHVQDPEPLDFDVTVAPSD